MIKLFSLRDEKNEKSYFGGLIYDFFGIFFGGLIRNFRGSNLRFCAVKFFPSIFSKIKLNLNLGYF